MGLFIIIIFVDTIVHDQHKSINRGWIIVDLYTQRSFKGFFTPAG